MFQTFLDESEKFFIEASAKDQTPVMISFELKGVRPFAARYGIEKGNQFLNAFSDLLKERFGESLSVRCGEYSFLACTLSDGMEEIIPEFLEEVKLLEGGDRISLKAGLYNRYRQGDDINTVCDRARLVCAKKSIPEGASGIFYFDDKMEEELILREFVVNNIDSAIENGNIKVYCQPVIRLLNERLSGLEALTRWEDPGMGRILPDVYIPILEDNNLTWKIDTFVLREIAKTISFAKEEGKLPLHITFNLTYSDFLVIDVPETIESIVNDHGIDPSYLFAEIDERTILTDPDRMKKEIERLNKIGLRVVIDDFGNGYSSINMLNDFRFYAIKIDREFMKSFNNRSKKIVESIIVMAKNLGIHTVAEGIETEEQMLLLRSVGCELAQGFYFDEPCPIDTVTRLKSTRFKEAEEPDERELFVKTGLINFISDQPMEIIFFDGEAFKLYFANAEMERAISHSGFTLKRFFDDIANSEENELGKIFIKQARGMMRSGRSSEFSFSFNGRFFRIEASVVAENSRGIMIQAFLNEGSSKGSAEEKAVGDSLLNELLPSFNNIYFVDFSENTARTIRAEYGYELAGTVYNYDSVIENYLNKGIVFPSDAERFRQTFTSENIIEKLKKFGRTGFSDVFRIKTDDIYKWILIKFYSVHGSQGMKVIICTVFIENEAQPEYIELSKRILSYRGEFSPEAFSLSDGVKDRNSFLWNSLMEMSDVRYFWKDSDRRFLGASRSFLDFYGLDIKDLVGRNDEEMGWHPDDTKYRSDEFDVLEKGTIIRNSPGQIYAKGERVNILATKYPLYRNGEIVGLLGYFLDTDRVLTDGEEMDHALYVDIRSGLLNSRGLFLTLQGLDDNYRGNGAIYAVSVFEAAEYQRVFSEFGKKTAESFSTDVGKIISECFGENAVIARSQSCGFTVCVKGVDPGEMEALNQRCLEEIKEKCTINGEKADIVVSCGSATANEGSSVNEVLTIALARLSVSKKYNGVETSEAEELSSFNPDMRSDIPLPFMVLRPVISENGVTDAKFIFINDKYLEFSGLSRSDLLGKGYRELFESKDDKWLELSGRGANGETVTGRSYISALSLWMEFVCTPSSIPGCCDIILWPVEDLKNERELLTKGHAADNAIIRIAGYLNNSERFEEAVKRSLAEVGRVLKPDRVYLLDPAGVPLYEWCEENVIPRMENIISAPAVSHERAKYFNLGRNFVIDDLELIRTVNHDAYEFLKKLGTDRYIIIPLFDNDSDIMGFVGADNYDRDEVIITRHLLEELSYFISSRMVTDRLLKRLNFLSNRDELTGLLNRHGFRNEIDKYLFENPDDPFTIVLIDVDDFKIVNDMYGHATGDEVLKNLSYDLNEIFGEKAIIARSGGDELCVAVKNSTAEDTYDLIKELSLMDHTFVFEEKTYPFRLSIGYAEYPAQADDLSLLLMKADSALYAVKSEGKHGFRQFSDGIKLTKRLQLAFNVKNVARNLPGALLVYKADDDKGILYANEELIKMFECDNIEDFMEYTGGTFDGIVYPDDIETVDKIIWDQINNNSYEGKDYVDYRIRTKTGKIKEVIDVGRFVENDFYGKVFYVIIIDKDERKSSRDNNDE